jgi:hypothetical protein
LCLQELLFKLCPIPSFTSLVHHAVQPVLIVNFSVNITTKIKCFDFVMKFILGCRGVAHSGVHS